MYYSAHRTRTYIWGISLYSARQLQSFPLLSKEVSKQHHIGTLSDWLYYSLMLHQHHAIHPAGVHS